MQMLVPTIAAVSSLALAAMALAGRPRLPLQWMFALGMVAEMVASLDPAAVSPSSPVALAELTQLSQSPQAQRNGGADPFYFDSSVSPLAEPTKTDAANAEVWSVGKRYEPLYANVDSERRPRAFRARAG